MLAEERRMLILKKIRENKTVAVQDLANEFKTSKMTIRRDLDYLNSLGEIKRSHGGAVAIEAKVGKETMYAYRADKQSRIKEIIGQKAASLIDNGECVCIDIGTTAYEVAKYINNKEDLTVITASIPVVMELMNQKNVRVICVGGELSRNDKSLNGFNAIRTIEEYVLDKAFIGVAGFSFDFGFTLFNMDDALVKREVINRSKEVIILMDSSKIGQIKHAKLCELNQIDKIITDDGISESDLDQIKSCGIEVIVVKKEEREDE